VHRPRWTAAGVRVVRMRRELVQDWASAGGYSGDPGSPRKGEGDTLDDDDLGNEAIERQPAASTDRTLSIARPRSPRLDGLWLSGGILPPARLGLRVAPTISRPPRGGASRGWVQTARLRVRGDRPTSVHESDAQRPLDAQDTRPLRGLAARAPAARGTAVLLRGRRDVRRPVLGLGPVLGPCRSWACWCSAWSPPRTRSHRPTVRDPGSPPTGPARAFTTEPLEVPPLKLHESLGEILGERRNHRRRGCRVGFPACWVRRPPRSISGFCRFAAPIATPTASRPR